jgi:hypothetical protein
LRDPADHLRRRLLSAWGAPPPAGSDEPSFEPALDGVRPLAALPDGRLIVVHPEEDRGTVGVAACAQ